MTNSQPPASSSRPIQALDIMTLMHMGLPCSPEVIALSQSQAPVSPTTSAGPNLN